jgi:hypothetical protein
MVARVRLPMSFVFDAFMKCMASDDASALDPSLLADTRSDVTGKKHLPGS